MAKRPLSDARARGLVALIVGGCLAFGLALNTVLASQGLLGASSRQWATVVTCASDDECTVTYDDDGIATRAVLRPAPHRYREGERVRVVVVPSRPDAVSPVSLAPAIVAATVMAGCSVLVVVCAVRLFRHWRAEAA